MSSEADESEIVQLEHLLRDTVSAQDRGEGLVVQTHTSVDSDAVVASALVLAVLPGARVVFESADNAVSSEQIDTIGLDVRSGARSVKGRGSSAAAVTASALHNLGFRFDAEVLELVEEVSKIDQGEWVPRHLRCSQVVNALRRGGWSDQQLVEITAECIRARIREKNGGASDD
jgi:hypothetical protein